MSRIAYTSITKRAFAVTIDLFVVYIIFIFNFVSISIFNDFLYTYYGRPIFDPTNYTENFFLQFLSICIFWFYFALMESSYKQATFGKIILQIKVTHHDGSRITFLRASLRHFSKYISILILGAGFLMILFNKERRGLHDIIANTLVIDSNLS